MMKMPYFFVAALSHSSPSSTLPDPVLADSCRFNQEWHRLQCEDLAFCGLQHSAHVFTPHLEASTRDACNDIVVFAALVAQRAQPLNASDLVTGCAVVFSQFGLDQCHGVEFVRDDEIRCLVKSRNAFCPPGLTKADPRRSEHILDCAFDHQANQFAHSVTVRSEWPAKNAFIEQNGVWHTKAGDVLNAWKTSTGVNLVQSMHQPRRCVGNAFGKRLHTCTNHCTHTSIPQAFSQRCPWCQWLKSNVSIHRSSSPLVNFETRALSRHVSPFRWCESENRTENDKRNRCGGDGCFHTLHTDVGEVVGGALQFLVASLESRVVGEAITTGHFNEGGMKLVKNFINQGIERKRRVPVVNIKALRHGQNPMFVERQALAVPAKLYVLSGPKRISHPQAAQLHSWPI